MILLPFSNRDFSSIGVISVIRMGSGSGVGGGGGAVGAVSDSFSPPPNNFFKKLMYFSS
jgi:hypothetical protein